MFGLKNYYFLVPLIGMVPWTGMLIAMLICWGLQGHPIYAFIGRYQDPVYISHIGATNLQPLFISCAGWQGLWFMLSILTDYRLRKTGKLQYWFRKSERNWLFAGVVFAGIGQLGILLCSCFKMTKFDTEHYVFLAIFIVGIFLCMVCLITQYFMMGFSYRKIHVNHKLWNKFIVSACLKLIWTVIAVVLACCFEGIANDSVNACFEWALAFWYTFLWLIISWDISSAAKSKHKNQPHIHDWSKQGYYLYERNYGSSDDPEKRTDSPVVSQGRNETLVGDQDQAYFQTNREFTDEELGQYPLTADRETYPIPHGQRIPVFDRVEEE